MPCIQIKTNVKTDEAAAEKIRKALGSSICHLPGKSEDWLLVSIQDDRRTPNCHGRNPDPGRNH